MGGEGVGSGGGMRGMRRVVSGVWMTHFRGGKGAGIFGSLSVAFVRLRDINRVCYDCFFRYLGVASRE